MPRILPNNFDQTKLWMFFIDHHFVQESPRDALIKYELREPGCIIGLFKAYRKMLANEDLPLLNPEVKIPDVAEMVANRICVYHSLLTNKVTKLTKSNTSGEFRTTSVSYGLNKDTSTYDGIKHLKTRTFVRGENGTQIQIYYVINAEQRLICNELPDGSNGVKRIFLRLATRLVQDLRKPGKKDVLEFIGEFLQDAMALHPFGDANNRTLVIILLNDILFSLNLRPTVFIESNIIDGYHIPKMAEEMRKAQVLFQQLVDNPPEATRDFQFMRENCLLHIASGAGEMELLRKICLDPAMDKSLFYKQLKNKIPLQLAIEYEQTETIKYLLTQMEIPSSLHYIVQVLFETPDSKEVQNSKIANINFISTNALQTLPVELLQKIPEDTIHLLLYLIPICDAETNTAIRNLLEYHICDLDKIAQVLVTFGESKHLEKMYKYFYDSNNLVINFISKDSSIAGTIDEPLKKQLLIASLYGPQNINARSYLIRNFDVPSLFNFLADCKKIKGSFPECIHSSFFISCAPKESAKELELFFERFLSADIMSHICIDPNTVIQIKNAFPDQEAKIINFFSGNQDLLAKICAGKIQFAIEMAEGFNAENAQKFLEMLKQPMQDALNKTETVPRDIINAISDIYDHNPENESKIVALLSDNNELLDKIKASDTNNKLRWLTSRKLKLG